VFLARAHASPPNRGFSSVDRMPKYSRGHAGLLKLMVAQLDTGKDAFDRAFLALNHEFVRLR
jgi:hypothetical protein